MYLLDTNHCSRLLQGHPQLTQKLTTVDNTLVATCVIVQGELMFMAWRSDRRAENRRNVETFLKNIRVYPVDSQVADIYGQIKAAILAHFGPKEKAKQRKAKVEKLGFSDNDLWIAAIAKRYGLTIVSADSDFERIKEVEDLTVEAWWRPDLD